MNHPAALAGQARLCRDCEKPRAFAAVASPLIFPGSLATTACEGFAARAFTTETSSVVIDRAYEVFQRCPETALIPLSPLFVATTKEKVEQTHL